MARKKAKIQYPNPTGYNGWENYQTWNVALWIQNDEWFYNEAKRHKSMRHPYRSFARSLSGMGIDRTPDRISFTGLKLDHDELDALIRES